MMKRAGKMRTCIVLLMAAILLLCCVFPESASGASYVSDVCTTSAQIHAAFPESYWAELDALLAAHPNWKFKAFHPGVTFEETLTTSAEMKAGRNLIEQTALGNGLYNRATAWYSTESGFNWADNCWTILSAPNWVQASKEAVAYCMDPRNFLNEEQIYQFLDHMSDATKPVVEYLLAQNGTYWTQSGEAADLYYEIEVEVPVETSAPGSSETGSSETGSSETGSPETGSSGAGSSEASSGEPQTRIETQKVYLSYADAFVKIGEELGISPAVLAARVLQEQGMGTSPLISGTKEFTSPSGETVSGYYNYFNIDATDGDGNADTELIYQSGLTEAYNGGWNTRYKALLGGAQKFYANYVAKGQYTYYMQKFNVDSSSTRQYWGQYMQNIFAPQSEAKKTFTAYSNSGQIDTEQLFIIPVFDSIPAEKSPMPTKDGNPNYKLNYIYVNGTALEGFNTDTLSYSLSVESDVTSVELLIKSYAATTTISVNGTAVTSQYSQTHSINYGDNVFTILCTAQNGDTRTYTLTVNRAGENLYGDVNGDGEWNVIDISYMRSHILGYQSLTGGALEAADVNGDGNVNVVDISYVRSCILKYMETVPQRTKGTKLSE